MRRDITMGALACVLFLGLGCGSDTKQSEDKKPARADKQDKDKEDELDWSTPGKKKPGPSEPAAPLAPMGVTRPSDFSYVYGSGASHYKKAEAAADKQDWAAVKQACEATIAANPNHLHGHYLLASALAKLGEIDAVAKPLNVALAGDWLRWGPGLDADPAFAEYLASEAGAALKRQNQAYGERFLELAKGGLLLVGRRSGFKQPTPSRKVQWSTTRGELFSYLRDDERYLRLTHTDESLAGWLMAPSGDEIAFVSYSAVDLPAKDAAPLLARIKIGIIDFATLRTSDKLASIADKKVRVVRLQYGDGDELLIQVVPPLGRWDLDAPVPYRLDKGAGKLQKLGGRGQEAASAGPSPTPTIELAAGTGPTLEAGYEWVDLDAGPSPDIEADDQAGHFKLASGIVVDLPVGEYVEKDGYRWSPNKELIAVRTMGRPCVGNPESALFLVEAATGKYKKLYAGKADLGIEWLDNDQFVYEDDAGELRIYDAAKRDQVGTLRNPAGLALRGLAAQRGAICKQQAGDAPDSEPGTDDEGVDDEAGDDPG